MADLRPDRLKWLIEDRRTDLSKIGRAIGLSQPSVGRLVSGETKETGKLLELAAFLRTTPEFIVGFSDVAEPSDAEADRQQAYRPQDLDRSDDVEIAHIDARYGLGGTFIDGHVEVETRSFSRTWLRQFTDAAPEQLFWTQGQGNSMEPTIRDGEVVLIDRGQNKIENADLYWAFAYGQVGMIKRLRPLPDGSVEILSDNASVPPARAVDDELHLIGRVVAVVKRI